MSAALAIVRVPATAKRGEIVEVKTLIRHSMETGFRRTQLGERIPRNIITRFICAYNGAEILRAELHPAVAANPMLNFTLVATESGMIECRWQGDGGFFLIETAAIRVI